MQLIVKIVKENTIHKPICYHEYHLDDLWTKENKTFKKQDKEIKLQDVLKQCLFTEEDNVVTRSPEFWWKLFYDAYDTNFRLPNGCCKKQDCPVKLFYEQCINLLS